MLKGYKLSIFIMLLFLATFFSVYYYSLGLGFSHDDLSFLTAKNAPDVFSADFLLHIFFKPNSYNTHYRPLGFFGYFFAVGKTFGANPFVFDFIGLTLMLISLLMFNKYLKKITNNKITPVLVSVLYLAHFSYLRVFLNYSDHLKYGVTLIILISMLFLTTFENYLNKKKILLLFLLQVVAIGCHEASFTFSFIFIILRMISNKKIERSAFLISIPSIIYLLSRVFLWGVPDKGYFSVQWSKSPLFFIQQIYLFLIPTKISFMTSFESLLSMSILPFFINILFFVIVFYISTKKKDLRFIFYILIWFFVQLPYSPLVNHWPYAKLKSAIWAAPFIFSAAALIIDRLKVKWSIAGTLVMFGVFFYGSQTILSAHTKRKRNEVLINQKNLKYLVDQEVKKCDGCVYKISTNGFTNLKQCKNYQNFFLENYTIPSFLAIYYPLEEFVITPSEGAQYLSIVVKGGYAYYQNKEDPTLWQDIFGFNYGEHRVKISSKPEHEILSVFQWDCS